MLHHIYSMCSPHNHFQLIWPLSFFVHSVFSCIWNLCVAKRVWQRISSWFRLVIWCFFYFASIIVWVLHHRCFFPLLSFSLSLTLLFPLCWKSKIYIQFILAYFGVLYPFLVPTSRIMNPFFSFSVCFLADNFFFGWNSDSQRIIYVDDSMYT